MELWMKIGSALLLGLMLIVLFPRARHMLRHSPKAQPGDWAGFVFPLIIIAGFVITLMWLI
jgi:hypothetical protein